MSARHASNAFDGIVNRDYLVQTNGREDHLGQSRHSQLVRSLQNSPRPTLSVCCRALRRSAGMQVEVLAYRETQLRPHYGPTPSEFSASTKS